MAFIEYKTAGFRQQVKTLIRKRLALKDRKRYHIAKINHHEEKIEQIDKITMVEIDKQIDFYLNKVENNITKKGLGEGL